MILYGPIYKHGLIDKVHIIWSLDFYYAGYHLHGDLKNRLKVHGDAITCELILVSMGYGPSPTKL